MKRVSYCHTLHFSLFCFLSIAITGGIQAKSFPSDKVNKRKHVELMIDVDAFDNLTVAKHYYKKAFYGPAEIAEFFQNCRKNGVKIVYWRCVAQIASYRSKLNYNLAQVPEILSNADDRRAAGAYAVKVGVNRKKCKLKELSNLDFGGIVQKVTPDKESNFYLSGKLLTPAPGAFLIAVNAATGKIIAKGKPVVSPAVFQTATLNFKANAPFFVGAMATGKPETYVFIIDELSLKTKSGKELLQNGNMEKHFMLRPTDWQQSGTDFATLNGDFRKTNTPTGRGMFKMLYRPYTRELYRKTMESCDPLTEAVKQAHLNGIKFYAWLDPIDDGRVVLPPIKAWSSKFMEAHPEYRLVDKNGNRRWGMLCFGYPEVRKHKTEVVKELLSYGVDGIALKMSYQHNLVWDGNSYNYKSFLFNDVILQEYDRIWGKPKKLNYEIYRLQVLYGNYFIQWLRELRPIIKKSGKRLCLFTRPGKYTDRICSSWVISPEKMIREKLIDDLLLEPRICGDNRGEIKRIDKELNYISLCQQYGIKVGYDFYLNGLVERVKNSNKHSYFRTQMLALSKENVDFLGIYEGMYVDARNFWPDINYLYKKIQKMPLRRALLTPLSKPASTANNLALFDKGAKAIMRYKNSKIINASELIDGERSNASGVCATKCPLTIEIKLPQVETIHTVKIYPGNFTYAENPSGICAPKAYRLEGLRNGKWIKLITDVKNASSKSQNGTLCFTHKFKPVKLNAVKLTVLKSGDTGCRIFSPKKAVIPPKSRATYIRSIELYGKK